MIDRYGSMGGFGTIVGYVGMALVVGVIGLPAIRARLSEPTVLAEG